MSSIALKFFYVLLFLLYIAIGINKTMTLPPRGTHLWRQADGAATASNIYRNNLNPFKIETFRVHEDGSRVAFGELPLPYLIPACLYYLFGEQDFFFRMITLIFSVIGIIYTTKFCHNVTKDTFFSYLAGISFIASPIFLCFSNSFLPDVHGVALAMVGLYYFHLYITKEKKVYFYYSIFFFGLSGLIKISAGILYFSIIGYVIIGLIFNLEKVRNQFKKTELVLLVTPVLFFVFMYWGVYYNSIVLHPNGLFIAKPVPLWELETDQRSAFFNNLLSNYSYWLYDKKMVFLVLISLLVSIFTLFKKLSFLNIISIISTFGIVAYVMLFAIRLQNHDYYYIIIVPVFILILMNLFLYLKKTTHSNKISLLFKLALFIFFCHEVYFSSLLFKLRYNIELEEHNFSLIDKERVDFFKWVHWHQGNTIEGLENINPYLRSIGIGKEELVISFPDLSPNTTLNYMKQNGFTNDFISTLDVTSEHMEDLKNRGASYLIINDPEYLKKENLKPYLVNPIGKHFNVSIYKL